MTITRDELAQLEAQRGPATLPVREGWQNGVLTVWVSGTPRHFKGKGNRYTVARHTKQWRERTAMRLWLNRVRIGCGGNPAIGFWPWSPKRITFTVYTRGRGFDGADNLRLVCSPCLDALGPRRPRASGMGLIDDDKNPAHAISYAQVTRATIPGIAIRVGLA